MKKRSNTSKRAVTELFSNSTDRNNHYKNTGSAVGSSESRREELKRQFFGTSPESAGGISSAVKPSVQNTAECAAEMPRSFATAVFRPVGKNDKAGSEMSTARPVGAPGAERRQASNQQEKRPSVSAMSGDEKSRTVRFSKVSEASKIPKDSKVSEVPKASKVLKASEAPQSSIASPSKSDTAVHTIKFDRVPAQTAIFSTVKPVRESAPSSDVKKKKLRGKMRGVRIALVSAMMTVFLAASVAAAVCLIPKEDEFVPADIEAGVEERLQSSDLVAAPSVMSEAAVEYMTAPRYKVSFKFYESPDITCTTPGITVGELMNKLGITLGENNRMYVAEGDMISEDCSIAIDTLSYETAYSTESVPYETVYDDIRTIPKGTTKVKVNGKNGEKTYTYKCTLVNGVEESREVIGEEITTKPTSRVLYRGIGGTVSSGGKTYNYSYYIDVKATVYNIEGTTATGRPTSTSVMAVDPSVIPLNTACVVKGGGDYGYRIAADTGGAIKGNKIDLWYPAGTFPGGFGWKSTRVYILG